MKNPAKRSILGFCPQSLCQVRSESSKDVRTSSLSTALGMEARNRHMIAGMQEVAEKTIVTDNRKQFESPTKDESASSKKSSVESEKEAEVDPIIEAVVETEKVEEPTVEMYLFIFLKFVSSIIPTINYDFTMDVTASTKK